MFLGFKMYAFNAVWAWTNQFATKESLNWYIDIAGDTHVIKSQGEIRPGLFSKQQSERSRDQGIVRCANLFFDIWLLKAAESKCQHEASINASSEPN